MDDFMDSIIQLNYQHHINEVRKAIDEEIMWMPLPEPPEVEG